MIGPEASRVSGAGAREVSIRPLLESDLDALVALDARTTGVRRLAYFERRRAAASRAPREHMQRAAPAEGRVVGWVLARLAGGQYGRTEVRLVLESLGVDPGIQRAGIGARLLARLDELASARGIGSIVTQVDWRNHSMLHFLDRAGFRIACTHVLARGVDRVGPEDAEPPPNVCRALRHDDLESLVRIDAALTGTPRPEYFRRQVEEALHEAAAAHALAFAVAGVPDEKKGERLVVLHTLDERQVDMAIQKLATMGLPNLFIPRREHCIKVDALPLLGTGKLDLRAIKQIALARGG